MNNNLFLNEHYLDIDVTLGQTVLTLKQLKNIQVGTRIELDKLAGEPLDIKVDNKFFARGEGVIIDENFGVRVTEFIEEKEHPIINEEVEPIPNYLPPNNAGKEEKHGHETLSQNEIDELLTAISSGDPEVDDFKPVKSARKIKIYDFKNPVIFDKNTIEHLGIFMQKFCTAVPSIFNEQVIVKLESITQLPKSICYKNLKTSFIDQWKWYSSKNYIEMSIDDCVIQAITGIKKQNDFYSKDELFEISSEISSSFITFLSKAMKQPCYNSEAPAMNHIKAVPAPEFLQNTSAVNDENDDCYLLEYTKSNDSMYVSIKMKIMSLFSKESSGFIYLNIPAEDLKKFIDTDNAKNKNASPNLDKIKITCDVSFGRTKRPISQIMDIGEGTIIELDRIAGEPVTFRANGEPIALGDILVMDEWFFIKITEIL